NREVEEIIESLEAFADRLGSLVVSHGIGQMLVTWYRHRIGALRRAIDRREATPAEDDSVDVALGNLMKITNAQRGFIVLRSRDGTLTFPAARTATEIDLQAPEVHISRTILQEALQGK